jgi:hypothetical protein
MKKDVSKTTLALTVGVAVLLVLFAINYSPSRGAKVNTDRVNSSVVTKDMATDPPIAVTPAQSPPAAPPRVQSGPESTASTGATETGPHGPSDVTKKMPDKLPDVPRVESDRPVSPNVNR